MIFGMVPSVLLNGARVVYQEDKQTQIRKALRTKAKAEVAKEFFGHSPTPGKALLSFCKKNSIPLQENKHSTYLSRPRPLSERELRGKPVA